eukprot:scaffold630_cov399-Prasinococcus_capsulatus_cf.AAC.34
MPGCAALQPKWRNSGKGPPHREEDADSDVCRTWSWLDVSADRCDPLPLQVDPRARAHGPRVGWPRYQDSNRPAALSGGQCLLAQGTDGAP